MLALWVDEGNDYDVAKGQANDVTAPCFALRDPRATKPYLLSVRDLPGVTAVGVYFAANWWQSLDGAQLAEKVSALCAPLFKSTAPDFPFVCADIETKSVPFVRSFAKRWRELRPQRVTDWTLEGHQGGLFSPADALVLTAAFRFIVPQAYNGAMDELWDTYAMAADLVGAGFPFASIRPFYDAAHLPEWWDGYAFTQGRLP